MGWLAWVTCVVYAALESVCLMKQCSCDAVQFKSCRRVKGPTTGAPPRSTPPRAHARYDLPGIDIINWHSKRKNPVHLHLRKCTHLLARACVRAGIFHREEQVLRGGVREFWARLENMRSSFTPATPAMHGCLCTLAPPDCTALHRATCACISTLTLKIQCYKHLVQTQL